MMIFIQQVQAGIVQDLQAYRNFPKRLLPLILSSAFFFAALCINPQQLFGGPVIINLDRFNILCTSLVFWMFLSERIRRQQSNIDKFLIINGMSKSANLTKIFLTNILLMVPMITLQVLTYNMTYTEEIGSEKAKYLWFFLSNFFVSSIATTSMVLLISRFSGVTQAIGSTLILFLTPGMLSSFKYKIGILFLLNPYILMGENLVVLALSIFYLCLYLFFEWFAEYRKKRISRAIRNREHAQVEISLAEMIDPLLEIEESGLTNSVFFEKQDLQSNKAILQIENLTKMFKGAKSPALDDISFQIPEKQVFCLIGHNGAGKTTMLNILTGLTSQTNGSIYYGDEEVNTKKIRESVGFCTQDNIALTENTVYQNLIFMAKIKNMDKFARETEVKRTMEKLSLEGFKDKVVSDLTQEQRKRLSIALAILNNPQIIILDEPTSGLDPVTRRVVWKIIEELKKDEKTVVFTTQFLEEAEGLSDKLAILSQGKLLALGSGDYIKEKFGTGYTLVISNSKNPANLVTQVSEIDKIIRSLIPTAETGSDTTLNILKYSLLSSEKKKFSRLFRELESIPNIQINLQRTNLEEAFKRLERDPYLDSLQVHSFKKEHIQDRFWTQKYETSFKYQFKMAYLQKIYLLKINKSVMVLVLAAPLLLTFLGWLWDHVLKIYFGSVSGNLPMTEFFLMYVPWPAFSIGHVMNDKEKYKKMFKTMGMKSFYYWLSNILLDCAFLLPVAFGSAFIRYSQANTASKEFLSALGYTVVMAISMVVMTYNCSLWIPRFGGSIRFLAPVAFCILHGVLFPFIFLAPTWKTVLLFSLPNFCLYPGYVFPTVIFPGAILSQFAFVVCKGYHEFTGALFEDETTLNNTKLPDNPAASKEKARLLDSENQDSVKIIGGHKFFRDGNRALWDLNFGVEKGQIFCLLGPNGSGKTAIFDIITGKTLITFGKAYVDGQVVSKEKKTSYTLGFCLQNDVLWDDFTVEQHFRLYACLKGMSEMNTDEAIEYFSDALDLKKHLKKAVKTLSGGTKRKLSVALALIERPDVIVLDEPTTGVDPVGRSQIWALLKTLAEKKKSTVLISTHYMEDAELVADKLGILVNGSLEIVGNIADIRKTYQEHYVTIEGISEAFGDSLIGIIKRLIPEAILDPTSDDKRMIFKVSSEAMKFTKVCWELESLMTDKKIVDFSIHVNTLGQTFLELAGQQVKKPNQIQNTSRNLCFSLFQLVFPLLSFAFIILI